VNVYIELVRSIKELSSRHNKFFNNEVGLVKMQNECSMLKKQLEQKEKECEDIRSNDIFIMNKQLVKQIEDTIDKVNSNVKTARTQIK
jgi:chemotaxis regulatin CheY-phosphate phosphatase CheZ